MCCKEAQQFERRAHEVMRVPGSVDEREGASTAQVCVMPDSMAYNCVVYPLGMAQRRISEKVPEWLEDKCTQCNYCAFVCPHGVIRPFVVTSKEAKESPHPQHFTTVCERSIALKNQRGADVNSFEHLPGTGLADAPMLAFVSTRCDQQTRCGSRG